MTKPVTIPNTFATATTAIPLSNLDADFSTVATALNDANTYSNYAPDTGSANAYVVTLSGVSTTYSAGLRIQFKAGNANTTASTLNVNGGGAKNITYQDATAIASGTIAANSIVDVMYDGTQFLLMNDPAGATGGDVVGPSSATDNAIVRFDGTTGKLVQNSVVTIADSTGDVSGVGQLNATTVDATNIEVTNIKAKDGTAAASIADSTGVISIASNPVLSGGTANGVLYLNGSKVATSGSALTFDGTNLTVGGVAGIGILGVRYTTPASGALATFLGTTDGTRSFQVNQSGSAYSYAGVGANELWYYSSSNYAALTFGSDGNVPIKWVSNGSEAMRLTSTGLGIGTSSPAQKLDVNNTSGATTGGIRVYATDQSYARLNVQNLNGQAYHLVAGTPGASNSGFAVYDATAGATRVQLDSSGNLGLGVTPSAWSSYKAIDINTQGSIASTGTQMQVFQNAYWNGTNFIYKTTNGAANYNLLNGSHVWSIAPSGTAGNAISFTQVLTLDASGNLLLGGTSTPTSSAGNLVMFNGTAPTGNVTNGCTLFCEDVSSSSELKVRDEAGNVTTLSPHNFSLIPEGPSEDMAWSYYSERDGKRINIDMLKAIRLLEKISGEQLVYES